MAKHCTACGIILPEGIVNFCPVCGAKQATSSEVSVNVSGGVQQSQIAAAGRDVHIEQKTNGELRPCRVCKGAGEIVETVDCPDCSGVGVVPEEPSLLPWETEDGIRRVITTKTVGCSRCGGNSKYYSDHEGSGKIDVARPCEYCNGQGWVRF
jgi:RNA polymerase subunit RPABC4/transcription elongation factor Spt4